MASHKLNPKPGETYFHPLTFNAYRIHSLTDDGWIRFQPLTPQNVVVRTIMTMPTLDFINRYKKQENNGA